MRDTTISKDESITRYTKIQREYLKIDPEHIYLTQKRLAYNNTCKEIDSFSINLLRKISEHYKACGKKIIYDFIIEKAIEH